VKLCHINRSGPVFLTHSVEVLCTEDCWTPPLTVLSST